MGRARWGAVLTVLIVAAVSCSSAPSTRQGPTHDIADARPIAREIGDILLTFAAYDYAVVGGINGDHIRAISTDRYADVARAQSAAIGDVSTKVVAAVIDTAGPIHDRMVTLADSLGDLRKDALAYADVRGTDALARIVGDVDHCWKLLRDVQSFLKDDGTLDQTITRGTSMKTAAAPGQRAIVTIGPYADAQSAADAAQEFGTQGVASTESPYVVRILFKDRASADAKAKDLLKSGTPALVTDQTAYAFTRSGLAPDAELWREPERFIDTHGGARKVALSGNASLVATGSDDGFIAVYTNDGVLRALPRFNAGVNQLVFTDDGSFLLGGGQLLQTWVMPHPPADIGEPMRLQGAAISAVYVPKANAFAASSVGVVGARAPDGVALSDPFPIDTGGQVAILATSDVGELFIAQQKPRGLEVDVLRLGLERTPRGVVTVPGSALAFAVDPTGSFGAAVTDQGTFRFSLKAADPTKSLTKISGVVRDVEFGPDSTLYALDPKAFTAFSPEGSLKWTQPLVDGRRLAIGTRAVVLDGTDKLIAFAPADGTPDVLAPVGEIRDLVVSRDGKWIGVIADARRAVLFKLP